MRTLIAALALASFSTTALAQTTTAPSVPATPPPVSGSCGEVPPPPAAPDAASATRAQMEAADQAYQAWRRQGLVVLECRRAQYNALTDTMNAANTAWGATVATYCARPHTNCERTQHSDDSTQPASPH